MITSFFKVSKPYHYVLFLLGLTVVFLHQFYHQTYLIKAVGFFEIIIKFLSLLVSVFFVVFTITKNNLTQNNSFAAFYFCLFIFLFPQAITKAEVVISNMFILLSYRRILSLGRRTNFKKKYFDAGIWLFIATLFYPMTAFFIIPILSSIIIWEMDAFKHLVAIFLGPFMLICISKLIYIIFNISIPEINFEFKMIDYEFLHSIELEFKTISIIFFSFILFSTLMIFKKVILKSSQKKSLFMILFLMCLTSFAIIFMSVNYAPSNFLFSFFPAAIVVANFTQSRKLYWISDIFILVMLVVYSTSFIINL